MAPRLTPELCARIRSCFRRVSRDEEHFASTIDPRIYHLKLIREHRGALGGKRVLDVGCGKVRFARALLEQEPEAELWGLDISEQMLRFVPTGVRTRGRSMTDLLFENDFFDGAYATASLEHAVEIERPSLRSAAGPGGHHSDRRNAGYWGKLKTPEWERWFARKELARLLAGHCRRFRAASFLLGKT